MEQSKKLRRVINYLTLEGKVRNIAEFADIIGQNRSGVSDKLNGRRVITDVFALRTIRAFPEVNPDYLLREDCEQMLMESTEREETLEQKIDKLIKMVELLIKKN